MPLFDPRLKLKSINSHFDQWTGGRSIASFASDSTAAKLPFQRWHRFKEAFAPELIAHAIEHSDIPVFRCVDPFGGSGTTGLACQFLGIHPTIAEVNPFLADLIDAKLTVYPSTSCLSLHLGKVIYAANCQPEADLYRFASSLPKTFVEPGHHGNWLFNERVAQNIANLRVAINNLENPIHQRLFKVLLGSILIELSNVTVSGKGRRYRRRWSNRHVDPDAVYYLFARAARQAIRDIHRFASRPTTAFSLVRGDSRVALDQVHDAQIAIFSPPYPNSFDYTDIYNVQLWVLGYLTNRQSNTDLRTATLTSHVQTSRNYSDPPQQSASLQSVLQKLSDRKDLLWSPRIPDMVGSYFFDLFEVMDQLSQTLVPSASVWIILGDSRYAGVTIPVAEVFAEIAECRRWDVVDKIQCRAYRSSAQQGGSKDLYEHLVVLRNQ